MKTFQQKLFPFSRFLYAAAVLMLLLPLLAGLGCTSDPRLARQILARPQPTESLPVVKEELTNQQQWRRLVRDHKNAPVSSRIAAVNEFFNQLPFAEDRHLWGKEDYWATLPETLARGSGDCEDLALAKYFTLLHLGIPDHLLRITYTFSLKSRQAHMVLAFIPEAGGDLLVLDTDNTIIFPVSKRPDLLPVYSFNRQGYWLARKDAGWQGRKIGSSAGLSMWRSVLYRMNMQG